MASLGVGFRRGAGDTGGATLGTAGVDVGDRLCDCGALASCGEIRRTESERHRDRSPRAALGRLRRSAGCRRHDEAVDVSLALVTDRDRIVTIAAMGRGRDAGIRVNGGSMPASAAFRDEARAGLIALAGVGEIVVPVARTYPLDQAREALTFLRDGHPGGKLALIP
jgi:hypothetical protein